MFMPKPEAVIEEAVLVAWLGFAEVDGAFEAFREGGGADREGAYLRLIRAFGGAFGAEIRFGFAAFALPVGGVGIDGEAFGQGDGGGADLGGLGGFGEELGGFEIDIQSRGGVGLVGGRGGLEDRFEDLVFAAFDLRVGRFGGRVVGGVGVGFDFESGGELGAGASGRVVDQRLVGVAGAGQFGITGGPFLFGAASGVTEGAFGKALGAMDGIGGEAPEGHLCGGQGGELGDVFDGEAEAVVGGGADLNGNRDRDVEDGDDEGEAGGLAF